MDWVLFNLVYAVMLEDATWNLEVNFRLYFSPWGNSYISQCSMHPQIFFLGMCYNDNCLRNSVRCWLCTGIRIACVWEKHVIRFSHSLHMWPIHCQSQEEILLVHISESYYESLVKLETYNVRAVVYKMYK